MLPPGPNLEPIAVNDLGDSIYATPALVEAASTRTLNTLYCFGKPKDGSKPHFKLQTLKFRLELRIGSWLPARF